MRINSFCFLISSILLCSCTSLRVFEPKLNVVYFYEVGNVKHEIKFLDNSKLKITQFFNCEKLTDSLRVQDILVNYEVIKSHKIRPYKESKKIVVYELKLQNLSYDNFEYPIVENDLDCIFLNEYNRKDRIVFENKLQLSTFEKLNIISFKESRLFYQSNDTTVSFALKVFKTSR